MKVSLQNIGAEVLSLKEQFLKEQAKIRRRKVHWIPSCHIYSFPPGVYSDEKVESTQPDRGGRIIVYLFPYILISLSTNGFISHIAYNYSFIDGALLGDPKGIANVRNVFIKNVSLGAAAGHWVPEFDSREACSGPPTAAILSWRTTAWESYQTSAKWYTVAGHREDIGNKM